MPESAAVALQELDWQLGDWTDQSEGVRVDMKVRWSPSETFLLRQFTIVRDGEEERTGTQIIGWDPRAQHIRSWMFDADGGFGDGVWSEERKRVVREEFADPGRRPGGVRHVRRRQP